MHSRGRASSNCRNLSVSQEVALPLPTTLSGHRPTRSSTSTLTIPGSPSLSVRLHPPKLPHWLNRFPSPFTLLPAQKSESSTTERAPSPTRSSLSPLPLPPLLPLLGALLLLPSPLLAAHQHRNPQLNECFSTSTSRRPTRTSRRGATIARRSARWRSRVWIRACWWDS